MPAWSGLSDFQHGVPYSLLGQRTNIRREISMAFERRGGRLASAIALALNGQNVGTGTAVAVQNQIQAVQGVSGMDLGGKRLVVQDQVINRVTTANDKTTFDAIYDGVFAPTTYPADRGGGGGGKLGTL